MKHSKWLILLCIVATVGLSGCSDDDDPVAPAPPDPEQAEAFIENALDTLVDPLLLTIEAFTDYLDTLPKSSTRATCPDTSAACSPGTLSCSPTTTGWDFTFAGCTLIDSAPPLSLNGDVEFGLFGTSAFVLDNLSVNGSTLFSGLINVLECQTAWEISADNSFQTANLWACPEENPQPESEFWIRIEGAGVWVVDFGFDGTSVATALVLVDMTPIAMCTVDLDTFDATCSDPV